MLAVRLRCSNLTSINFGNLRQFSVYLYTLVRSLLLNSTNVSINDFTAGNWELQSPAYELAENFNETRSDGTVIEIRKSPLKLRSRWTSIRPHLSLSPFDADRRSETTNDSLTHSSDSNFHSNSLPSGSLFGTLVFKKLI